jgi:hypothetical protein
MARAAIGLLLAACSGPVRVPVPVEAMSGSEILIVGDDEEPRVSFLLDLSDPSPLEFEVLPEQDTRIEAWVTSLTPDELELSPGEVELDEGFTASQLGLSFTVFTASVGPRRIDPWRERPSGWPDRVRFRVERGCLQRGGCFAENGIACLVPCPAPESPLEPMPPAVPTASCAPGWQTVELKPGISACTPWLGDVPECPGDQTIFPGESTCHPLGPGCPAGDFATSVPAGPRLYVLAGATGGDGRENAPLGSIQMAIDRSTGGEVIVIGAGVYREALNVVVPVTLFGACPERTSIDGPSPPSSETPAILVSAPGVSIANLRITGDNRGLLVQLGASFVLEDAIVDATGNDGLWMPFASRADLRRVLFRDTGGVAFRLENGAGLSGEKIHIQGAGTGAIMVDAAELSLSDAVVRDSIFTNCCNFGRGISAVNGSTLVFARVLFSRHHDAGVLVDGSVADLDRIVVRETQEGASEGSQHDGIGLLFDNDTNSSSELTVRRSWIDANRVENVRVAARGSPSLLEDVVLSRAKRRPSEDPVSGINLHARDTNAIVIRVAAVDAEGTAIRLETSNFELRDITVIGAGIGLEGGDAGDGIEIEAPATVRLADDMLERIRIEGVASEAITVVSGEEEHAFVLRDIDIAQSGGADCVPCSGICAFGTAQIDAERIRIDRAHASAVLSREFSKVRLTEAIIRDTQASTECRSNVEVRLLRGIGLHSDGGTIEANRFLITGSGDSGVEIAELTSYGASLDLSFGAIEDNPIGASILVSGFDVRRIGTRVRYERNQIDLNFGQEGQ